MTTMTRTGRSRGVDCFTYEYVYTLLFYCGEINDRSRKGEEVARREQAFVGIRRGRGRWQKRMVFVLRERKNKRKKESS